MRVHAGSRIAVKSREETLDRERRAARTKRASRRTRTRIDRTRTRCSMWNGSRGSMRASSAAVRGHGQCGTHACSVRMLDGAMTLDDAAMLASCTDRDRNAPLATAERPTKMNALYPMGSVALRALRYPPAPMGAQRDRPGRSAARFANERPTKPRDPALLKKTQVDRGPCLRINTAGSVERE